MFEADRMRRGDDEARKASIVHGLERQVDDLLEALARPDRFIGDLERPADRVDPAQHLVGRFAEIDRPAAVAAILFVRSHRIELPQLVRLATHVCAAADIGGVYRTSDGEGKRVY